MADPFDRLDQLYASLGVPNKAARQPVDVDPGLLASLANRTLPLLSYVGGSLDKPGRAVRGGLDMLTGGNTPASELLSWIPFSDSFGFTNEQNAASGRDILENLGAPKNQEGFFNSPTDSAWDVAGLATEVVTDPLSLLSLGTSAVGKAGKFAKSAGILPEGAAGRAAGTLKSQIDELMAQAGRADEVTAPLAVERLKRVESAAESAGYGRGGVNPLGDLLLDPMATEKLGGAYSIGVPGFDPLFIGNKLPLAGLGEAAYGVAKKTPLVGRALGAAENLADGTGRLFNQAFDARAKDTSTRLGQEAARDLTERERMVDTMVRGQQAQWAQLRRSLNLGDDSSDELWELVEGVKDPAKASRPELADFASKMRTEFDGILGLEKSYGIDIDKLADPTIKYAYRQLYEGGTSEFKRKARSFNTLGDEGREAVLKGITGGTSKIRGIAKEIEQMGLTGDADAIRKHIDANYMNDVLADSPMPAVSLQDANDMVNSAIVAGNPDRVKKAQEILKETQDALAKRENKLSGFSGWLGGLNEEQLSRGGFAGDPMILFGMRKKAGLERVHAADNIFDMIAKEAKPSGSIADGVSVGEILKAAGLKTAPDGSEGALMRLSEKMFGPGAFDPNLGKMVVPKELAGDMGRFIKGFTQPDPVNAILKLTDSYTNLWKAGVLTRPARYVRDFVSGAWQNYVIGEFNPKMYSLSNKLLRQSGPIDGIAAQFPKLGKTDAEVTEVIRRMAYSEDLIGHYKGSDVLRSEIPSSDYTINEMMQKMTGENPFDWKQVGKKLVGHKDAGTSWNPLDVRGFNDREQTLFGPAAAGEDLSFYTDSMNRLPGFLNQIKRGVAPDVAAAKIRAAQVDYSGKALSQFESKRMARLFPFFRFTKGMVPMVLRELYENPGGKMAKTLTAASRARSDQGPMPENVANSLSIPVSESADGTKRFLTNFGVAYEDPLQLMQIGDTVGGTVGGTLNELLSRANPLVKGAAELATGKLLFGGGQDIRDADPAMGRTISNIAAQFGAEVSPEIIRDRFGMLPEYLSSMTPYVGSTANAARTLADPRKEGLIGAAIKGTNVLSGFKFTDVSPQAQSRVLTDLIQEAIRDSGGSVFETPYLSKRDRAQMSPERTQAVDELLALDREQQKLRRRERAATQ